MATLGIAGWSGSGKTTLLERLIPILRARGLRIATIKHTHHDFDVDTPGKDSWRHRRAGAGEVLVSSGRRWVLMHELEGAEEPPLAQHLNRLAPCDLVLVEGWKTEPVPRIEVHRQSLGTPLLARSDPWIIAIASDQPLAGQALPVLDLDDPEAVACFVLEWLAQGGRTPAAAAAGERQC